MVQYTRLDGEKQTTGNKASKFASQFNETELNLLKTLNVGDEFVVNKVERKYTTSDGRQGTAWDLDSIADITTYKPKQSTNNTWQNNKKGGGGWNGDNVSAKIGGLIHDAVALLGQGASVRRVGEVTRELLVEAYAIGAEAATGAFKAPAKATPTPFDVISTNNTEVDDDVFGSLANIDF